MKRCLTDRDFDYLSLASVMFLAGLLLGGCSAHRRAQREAVKAGHAVWVDTSSAHWYQPQRVFKWKEIEQ